MKSKLSRKFFAGLLTIALVVTMAFPPISAFADSQTDDPAATETALSGDPDGVAAPDKESKASNISPMAVEDWYGEPLEDLADALTYESGAASIDDGAGGKKVSITTHWNDGNGGHASINSADDLFTDGEFSLSADVTMGEFNYNDSDLGGPSKRFAFTIGTNSNYIRVNPVEGFLSCSTVTTNFGYSLSDGETANIRMDYSEDASGGYITLWWNGTKVVNKQAVGFKLSGLSGTIANIGRTVNDTNYLFTGEFDNIIVLNSIPSEAVVATGISVKTQPRLSYGAGQSLNLGELVATITYSDNSTRDIPYANFTANEISVAFTGDAGRPIDDRLKLEDDGKTLTLSLGAFTVPTSAITVNDIGGDPNLLAEYDFTERPDDGITVPNTAVLSEFGDAVVQNDGNAEWSDKSLVFVGGGTTNSSTANWVRLPNDILKGKAEATISIEVNVDSSMLNNWNFLWNIGNSGTTTHWFTSVRNTPRTVLKTPASSNTEMNTYADAPIVANRWYSITSVVKADGTLSFYIDGVKVGETKTGTTPADIADQSLNTIGRAPYNDPLFKGAVSTFRVWDRALSDGEIDEVSSRDAALHSDSFSSVAQGIVDAISPITLDDSSTALNDYGGAVTWESKSSLLTLSGDGKVVSVVQTDSEQTATLSAIALVRGVSAAKDIPVTIKPEAAPTDDYGYLMVHFIEDSAGYAEKIYLDITRGDNPEQWDPLNGGIPILASHLGSTGIRDPYLTYSPETDTYYIIATDLRVFGGDNGRDGITSWDYWTRKGMTTLNVWESKDLVTWSDLRQFDVTLTDGDKAAELGNAWAPEATWAPDYYGPGDGAFILYFSAKAYAFDNPDHTGTAPHDRVLWGATKDFTQATYEYGGDFVNKGRNTIDTTIIQNDGKTYRITKDNGSSSYGIYMESTNAQRWWESGTTWTEGQRQLGAVWAGGNAGGVEGPAVFKDHNAAKWYLYVDVIPSTGYRPLVSTNLDSATAWQQLNSADFYMAPSTKHGGVISLTKTQYDAIRAADAASLTRVNLGSIAAKVGTAKDALKNKLPQTAKVNLAYERGTADLPVDWDLANVDIDEAGAYNVTGTVRTIGANLNQWVGANGSTDWDAEDRTLYSSTALTVNAKVNLTNADLLAWYEFKDTGTTVADSSGNGNEATLLGTGGTIADGVLTLPGGANTSGAGYVQMPTGMFDGQDTLTISVWLKNETGAGNYAAMFFGTTENNPRQYWLLNPSNGDGRFKTVVTNGNSSSAPWGTEYGISPTTATNGVPGPVTDNAWALYTTIITEDSITGYYNDQLVGTVPTSRSVSQFGSDLVAYIGRSSYPDMFYKGGVADVRVYTEALTAESIKALYEESEMATKLKLTAAIQALSLGDTSYVIGNLDLPATGLNGSTITWASDSSAVGSDGTVSLGDEAVDVTLTATVALNGITMTKDFAVHVVAASDVADAVLGSIFVPAWLTGDSVLPLLAMNKPIVWTSDVNGLIAANGEIVPQAGVTKAKITATVGSGDDALSKVFEDVNIIGEATYALSYTRTPVTGNNKINAGMHLALAADDGYEALNHNRGVLFPKASYTLDNADDNGTTKVIQTPYVFRKTDGTFGVVAVRRNVGGAAQNTEESASVIIFDSEDLTGFTELGLKRLVANGSTVTNPVMEYDASAGKYAIWYDVGGETRRAYTEDFTTFTDETIASKPGSAPIQTTIADAVPVNTVPLTAQEAKVLRDRLATVVNVSVEGPGKAKVAEGGTLTSGGIGGAVAHYSDGSSAEKSVAWDLSSVDFNTPGDYEISGVIEQEEFAFPIIGNRADPNMIKFNGYYYFISTDDNGQDEFFVRKSATIEGIKTAPDNKILGVPVQDMLSCLWAPEFHVIGGDLYLYFAGSSSASSGWAYVSARVMKLKEGGDPSVADDWEAPKKIYRSEGFVLYSGGITLDMTIVKDSGKIYAIWSQRSTSGNNFVGPADLYIGELNQNEPWKLKSAPVRLIRPTYSWDRNTSNVVEGAYALKNDGKIYVTFSGSNVDLTYCVGMLTAEEGADLLDPNSWTKTNYPVLDSGSVTGQNGPGHNSYMTDDNGKIYNIFHASPAPATTRDFGIRPVHFANDGRPILDMTPDREILPENRTVKTIVQVGDSVRGELSALLGGLLADVEDPANYTAQSWAAFEAAKAAAEALVANYNIPDDDPQFEAAIEALNDAKSALAKTPELLEKIDELEDIIDIAATVSANTEVFEENYEPGALEALTEAVAAAQSSLAGVSLDAANALIDAIISALSGLIQDHPVVSATRQDGVTEDGMDVQIEMKGVFSSVAEVFFDGNPVTVTPPATPYGSYTLSYDGKNMGIIGEGDTGLVVISLYPSFTNTLNNGSYELLVLFRDSYTQGVGGAEIVVSKPAAPDKPDTPTVPDTPTTPDTPTVPNTPSTVPNTVTVRDSAPAPVINTANAVKRVRFSANGGKISSGNSSVTVEQGAAIGTLPKVAARKGYSFKGWYTLQKGGVKISEVTKADYDATYYAQWTAKKYKLTLNANGGKIGNKKKTIKTVTFDSRYGKLSTPKRAGYKFLGWYTKKAGGKRVTLGDKVKTAKNMPIYAHWKKIL